MATYRMPWDDALYLPLTIAFCLCAAAAEREGDPLPELSFAERDLLRAIHGIHPPPQGAENHEQNSEPHTTQ